MVFLSCWGFLIFSSNRDSSKPLPGAWLGFGVVIESVTMLWLDSSSLNVTLLSILRLLSDSPSRKKYASEAKRKSFSGEEYLTLFPWMNSRERKPGLSRSGGIDLRSLLSSENQLSSNEITMCLNGLPRSTSFCPQWWQYWSNSSVLQFLHLLILLTSLSEVTCNCLFTKNLVFWIN